jgi:hypothetical protein
MKNERKKKFNSNWELSKRQYLKIGNVEVELLALGEADWTPPSSKTALSSSLTASFPNSTNPTSECLLANQHPKLRKKIT